MGIAATLASVLALPGSIGMVFADPAATVAARAGAHRRRRLAAMNSAKRASSAEKCDQAALNGRMQSARSFPCPSLSRSRIGTTVSMAQCYTELSAVFSWMPIEPSSISPVPPHSQAGPAKICRGGSRKPSRLRAPVPLAQKRGAHAKLRDENRDHSRCCGRCARAVAPH
jgi:hypothetical protein